MNSHDNLPTACCNSTAKQSHSAGSAGASPGRGSAREGAGAVRWRGLRCRSQSCVSSLSRLFGILLERRRGLAELAPLPSKLGEAKMPGPGASLSQGSGAARGAASLLREHPRLVLPPGETATRPSPWPQ